MESISTYDAIIIGGGPAGSTCAATLVKNGVKTLVLDRATFPRVKLCAGWVSPPIWDVLGIAPTEYPLDLWQWNNALVHFRDQTYKLKAKGYFIRRYEFDEYLLRRCGAEVVEGHNVRKIERDEEGFWVIDQQYRAKYLVGAGGSHCPVARALFPKHPYPFAATQEKEFAVKQEDLAASRPGEDGEPEILLHDDLMGYSWNIPKAEWINIGTGTAIARAVVPAWHRAREFFEKQGTIPESARPELERMKGHGYTSLNNERLSVCQGDHSFLVGDALGLAQPLTGEGILPAVVSGKICAEAIAEGRPDTYRKELRKHPIISDYQIFYSAGAFLSKFLKSSKQGPKSNSAWVTRLTAIIFMKLFSGKPIPGSRLWASLR